MKSFPYDLSRRMAGIAFAVLCLLAFSEATVFVDEPDNLIVKVGGQATFRCGFNKDYDCSVSQWVYSSSQCTRGSFVTIATCQSVSLVPSIDTSRFSSTFGKSTTLLQINDVQLSDAGYYACRIADLNEFSRCGHLTVVDPPTPQCTMLSSSVRVGDTVRLMCRVPVEALTRTKLTWHPPETPGSIRSLKTDPGQSFTIERVLQESDKFGVFTCIAGNDIHNGPNCTLYPFEIKTVSVRFQQEKSGGNSALMFECVADAALPDTRYSWSVSVAEFPNGTQPEWIDASTDERFVIVGDQTRFLLLIPGEDDDGLQVRCMAYSAIGTSKTSEALTLIGCTDGHFVTNNTDCADIFQESSSYIWMAAFAPPLAVLVIFLLVFFIKKRLGRKTTDTGAGSTTSMTTHQPTGLLSDPTPSHDGPNSSQTAPPPTMANVTTQISGGRQSSFAPMLPPPKPLPLSQRRFQPRGMTAPPLKSRGQNAPPVPITDSTEDCPAYDHIQPRIPRRKSTRPTVKDNPDTPESAITVPEYMAVGGGREPQEATPMYSLPNITKGSSVRKQPRVVQPYAVCVIENS